jgi:uncharacterized protein (DUF305 family)
VPRTWLESTVNDEPAPLASNVRRSARVAVALAALTAMAVLLGRGPARAEAHQMAAPTHAGSGTVGADTFMSMMDEAMRRMDAGMNVAPTGDPDRDFARMMIPHHQGAVDMALAELRFGKDERLRRLAQGIIVEQRQEIALMQSILDGKVPSNAASR